MQPYWTSSDGLTVVYHALAEEVLPTLPAGSVDMVFTSPPYNLGTTTGGGFAKPLGHYSAASGLGARGNRFGKWSGGALAGGYGEHDDAMPHGEYVAWQQSILTECWSLLSERGAIFYNHKPRVLAGRLVTPLEYLPPELAESVRQAVIWARAGGVNFAPTHYLPTHEWIVVLARAAWRLRGRAASGIGDVWMIPQESGSPHPAPFPLALPTRAIETAAPGSVLDPFMGSGTTLEAARNAGIPAIGIEREERWCEYTARRLEDPPLLAAVRASQAGLFAESAG
jgi:site-specific DNA-methyltransferase (adenine-specific)